MIKINKRVSFIDMMKGFLILTVVIGHANITLFGFDVFWFHMPSFFIITGLLTKKFICLGDNKSVIEKALHFIIPYLSYSIVLYLIFREDNVFKYIMRVILAGRMNITTFSYPFWYIFSLFWALLFYGTIKKINSSDKLTGGGNIFRLDNNSFVVYE